MCSEQLEASAVEGGASCSDLREDVHAVAVIIDHFLDAGDLSRDAAEASFDFRAFRRMVLPCSFNDINGFHGSFADLW
jgi:hypothetical protein